MSSASKMTKTNEIDVRIDVDSVRTVACAFPEQSGAGGGQMTATREG